MVILSNGAKAIQYSYGNMILGNTDTPTSYTVELPTVVCSDKNDAEYVQQEINKFVSNLSREIIK